MGPLDATHDASTITDGVRIPCHRAAPQPVDPARSDAILDRALDAADILSPAQKTNVRRKAEDLLLQRTVWESSPFRLLYEFNRSCNVRCRHCDIVHNRDPGMSMAALERLLEDAEGGVQEIMPIVGGEPTLAPIDELAELARRYHVWVNFITNGILFDRYFYDRCADVTSRIQFSFHSHRREVFEKVIPGADFDGVVRNLGDAVQIARGTGAHIVPCIVPMYDMLDHLPEYVDFVADLGVDRLIVQKVYRHTRGVDEIDPAAGRAPEHVAEQWGATLETAKRRSVFIETCVDELFGDADNVPRGPSRFDFLQDNAHIVELYHPGFCISTANQLVVEWDGTALPCIRDRIVLGNFKEQGYQEIWNGPRQQELRRSHFKRQLSHICRQCALFYLGHP